jgi:hypothetical protein
VQVELVAVDPVSLTVYDIMGRQMSDAPSLPSLRTDRVIYVIDTQSYQPGLYLIRIDLVAGRWFPGLTSDEMSRSLIYFLREVLPIKS